MDKSSDGIDAFAPGINCYADIWTNISGLFKIKVTRDIICHILAQLIVIKIINSEIRFTYISLQ